MLMMLACVRAHGSPDAHDAGVCGRQDRADAHDARFDFAPNPADAHDARFLWWLVAYALRFAGPFWGGVGWGVGWGPGVCVCVRACTGGVGGPNNPYAIPWLVVYHKTSTTMVYHKNLYHRGTGL